MKSYLRFITLIVLYLTIPGLTAMPQTDDNKLAYTLKTVASLMTQTFDFVNYFDYPAPPDDVWSVSIDVDAKVDDNHPCTLIVDYERDTTHTNGKVYTKKLTWHIRLAYAQPSVIHEVVANELTRPKLYAIRGLNDTTPEMPAGLDEDVAVEIARLLRDAATQCHK